MARFRPRLSKRISNLNRAINKIDPKLKNRVMVSEHRIEDIEPGISTIKYSKDGVRQEIRYDELANLSMKEQGSLLNELSIDRYNLRQERAIEQLKTKGKISWQFKRSIEQDNPLLAENIREFEATFEGNDPEKIKEAFKDVKGEVGEDWFNEADSYFNKGGTPELFDFYKPGEAGGFAELTAFTWNAFKVARGID